VLTERVPRLIGVADPFLTEMAPWWADAGRLLANHNMLSGHFSPTKHYFSAMLAFPGLYNLSVTDPLADVDPYPGPGNAFGRSYE
jgi:phospholipid/cholesterol/gamma-HCH transport system substrate-binding protein